MTRDCQYYSGVQMMASDDGVSVFERVRPRLFGIAYRMLGSAAEAEDIVQDAWLRWQGTDRSAVVDPPAFLLVEYPPGGVDPITGTVRLHWSLGSPDTSKNRIPSSPA